jgi:MYXO-CTERM domain-containing protein
MVTDTARKRILLFGGSAGTAGEVWEWDGATLTWTLRPAVSAKVPASRNYPVASYDEARGKLVVYDGSRSPSVEGESTSAYWEWDVVTGGWSLTDPGDTLGNASNVYAVYDSARRRHVLHTDVMANNVLQTWELDARSGTWYVRSLAVAPGSRFRAAMSYDSGRRVAVLFGGTLNTAPGGTTDDVWEYQVGNLANGEGCTVASATTCASGNCVDGVCCESAGCTGACKSCNVPGSAGTCVLAQAGAEVPGSCSDGQACDGTGTCKSKNGQACSAASACASGFCVDGVCCDGACAGTCTACNLAGRIGTCTAHAAGSDPNGECGQGTGACKSTCDGVGACSFPFAGVSCGSCLTCDGAGTCSRPDPACSSGSGGSASGKGGVSGKGGTSGSGGKSSGGAGGSGGSQVGGSSSSGGTQSGGSGGTQSGGSGGTQSGGSGGKPSGGSGGTSAGGSGGAIPPGTGGAVGGSGGTSRDAGPTTARGGAGGSADGGSSGSALDSGAVKRDGGDGDAARVASLHHGGCSCEVGPGEPAGSGSLPWLLVAGAAMWLQRRGGNSRRG